MIFGSNEDTPFTLHTSSLYFLFTCAKLRVLSRSNLGSISAANTSGRLLRRASRMEKFFAKCSAASLRRLRVSMAACSSE